MPRKNTTKQTREERLSFQRTYREAHQAERREYNEAHREKNAAHQRAWNGAHREEKAAKARAYYESHREELLSKESKERRRAYLAANRERTNAASRARRDARRKEINAHNRAKYAADPDNKRVLAHKRSARKKAASGAFTAREWRSLCEWFGSICLCCGADGKLSADHVIPLVRGGSNDISNIQPLCLHCNKRKSTKTTDYRDPSLFAAFLEKEMLP